VPTDATVDHRVDPFGNCVPTRSAVSANSAALHVKDPINARSSVLTA
jgi:hypothetical protein